MAFIKLNEVTLVESAVEPNILIEEDGEIKRLPAENFVTPQTQADWNETDATKPSFILNKPESLGGSGGKVVVYTLDSGALKIDGIAVTMQEVLDEWESGSTLKIKIPIHGVEGSINYQYDISDICTIRYTMSSGLLMASANYYNIETQAMASIDL